MDRLVCRDDGESLCLGLGDQQAIERVAVMRRQFTGAFSMKATDREFFKAFFFNNSVQIGRRRQFADGLFNRDFPCARGADIDLIGGILDPLKKHVSVQ